MNEEKEDKNSDIDFSSPCIILSTGKCKSGKTNAIKYLILKNSIDKKIFNFGIVFTRTKFNSNYDYIDQKYVFQGYQVDVLKKYISNLENIMQKKGKVPPNFIIFDDLLGLLSKQNGFLNNLFACHRHTNTSIFLCTQHLKSGASTTLREIVNYAICFNSKRRDTIESLYTEFGQLFDSYDEFRKHFLSVTKEKYHAMLYNSDIEYVNDNCLTYLAPSMDKINTVIKF